MSHCRILLSTPIPCVFILRVTELRFIPVLLPDNEIIWNGHIFVIRPLLFSFPLGDFSFLSRCENHDIGGSYLLGSFGIGAARVQLPRASIGTVVGLKTAKHAGVYPGSGRVARNTLLLPVCILLI